MDLIFEIMSHGAVGRLPVTETNTVVFGVSSQINNDTHKQKADEGDDLDTAKPEFEFTENSYSEQVDKEDWRGIGQNRLWACGYLRNSLNAMKITVDCAISHRIMIRERINAYPSRLRCEPFVSSIE